jgi:hypothetical protein
MRVRAADLLPRLGTAADAPDPGLVRVLDRVPARPRGRRLVAAHPDLEARRDAESPAALGARRAILGKRSVRPRTQGASAWPRS